jgi:hypothetical protein
MQVANQRVRTEWGWRSRAIGTARLSFNAALSRQGRVQRQTKRRLIAHDGGRDSQRIEANDHYCVKSQRRPRNEAVPSSNDCCCRQTVIHTRAAALGLSAD